MSTFAPMRRAFAAALVVAAMAGIAASANAADPPAPTYVVVSLIGDEITVVQARPQSITRMDTNQRDEIPVNDATFDRMAMAAAEAEIRRVQPRANVLQAAIRDKRLFALQEGLLADTGASRDMRAAMQGLLANHGATHLVLVTKRRSPASFRIKAGSVGRGFLAGIGFYLDTVTRLHYDESNQESPGFVAPYAYLSVALVDAATLRTVKSATAQESSMSLSIDSKLAVTAWDALSAEQKVEALEGVIKSGVARATAAALAE
jgi:hypothetical protein